jgi:hypothetical protein
VISPQIEDRGEVEVANFFVKLMAFPYLDEHFVGIKVFGILHAAEGKRKMKPLKKCTFYVSLNFAFNT